MDANALQSPAGQGSIILVGTFPLSCGRAMPVPWGLLSPSILLFLLLFYHKFFITSLWRASTFVVACRHYSCKYHKEEHMTVYVMVLRGCPSWSSWHPSNYFIHKGWIRGLTCFSSFSLNCQVWQSCKVSICLCLHGFMPYSHWASRFILSVHCSTKLSALQLMSAYFLPWKPACREDDTFVTTWQELGYIPGCEGWNVFTSSPDPSIHLWYMLRVWPVLCHIFVQVYCVNISGFCHGF